jgi:hypothetical protein
MAGHAFERAITELHGDSHRLVGLSHSRPNARIVVAVDAQPWLLEMGALPLGCCDQVSLIAWRTSRTQYCGS